MKKRFLFVVLSLLVGQCLVSSCDDDDPVGPKVEEKTPEDQQSENQQPEEQQPEEQQPEEKSIGSVKIGFSSAFSPDLLELVTPIIQYKDKDGEHEVRLTKDVCSHDEYDIDLGDTIFHYDRYKWTPQIVCDMFADKDLDETISIRYEPNTVAIDEERKYKLSSHTGVNNINCNFLYDGKLYISSSSYMTINLTITIGDGQTHDDDIYTGESVQMYIDELVKSKQDFRVEVGRDGKVKLNGK